MSSLAGREKEVIGRIWRVLVYVRDQIRAKLTPMAYVRALGVKLGKNVTFYAVRPGMFSTEPWLITIGDNVYVTAGCQFITHDGGTLILRREIPDLELTAPIIIGNDVYVGVNTTILPGVRIGNRVIIGAGSIVAKDIPNNCVAAGVPARVVKTVDEYLESAKARSLHFGHLGAREKEKALRKHFNEE